MQIYNGDICTFNLIVKLWLFLTNMTMFLVFMNLFIYLVWSINSWFVSSIYCGSTVHINFYDLCSLSTHICSWGHGSPFCCQLTNAGSATVDNFWRAILWHTWYIDHERWLEWAGVFHVGCFFISFRQLIAHLVNPEKIQTVDNPSNQSSVHLKNTKKWFIGCLLFK